MRRDKRVEDVYKKLLEEGVQKKNARLILEGLIPTMGLGRLTSNSPWLCPDKKLEEGRSKQYILSREVEEDRKNRKSFFRRIAHRKSDKHVERDAKQGRIDGQIAHGMNLVVKGDKVEEGIRWIKIAIERGSVEATALLGQIYFEGINVARDNSEAVKYLKKASDQGDTRSTTLLAIAYLYGLGTTVDIEEELMLLKKADSYADFVAGCLLPAIENMLETVKTGIRIAKIKEEDRQRREDKNLEKNLATAIARQNYHEIIEHLNEYEKFQFDLELRLLSAERQRNINEEVYAEIVSGLGPDLKDIVEKARKEAVAEEYKLWYETASEEDKEMEARDIEDAFQDYLNENKDERGGGLGNNQ